MAEPSLRDPEPRAPDSREPSPDGQKARRDRRQLLERAPLPEATVEERRGLSIVWVIPLVAALIAGWLAWQAWSSQGPVVTIAFETAEGLEPGKTRVKYREVEVGTVDAVRLSPDLGHIVVTAKMVEGTDPYLTDTTRFWIVRPRVGVGGVTGLTTLVSGAYIEIDPGTGGEWKRDFVGLEEPPLIRSYVPGRTFVLRADSLGSIFRGAPVYFRGIEVGQVLGYELTEDQRELRIPIFVRAPHDALVRATSRFWNASGVKLETSAEGFKVNLSSLQALLVGGIEFDTPGTVAGAPPAAEGAGFPLFADAESAQSASFTRRVPFLVEFEGSTRGLRPGAPVEVRGIRIGTVVDVALAYRTSATGQDLVVQALIEIEPERVQPLDAETRTPLQAQPVEELVARGLRAQLKTGNLLTGELLVDLDFHPQAPAATMRDINGQPVIPSVPTQFDTLSASVSGILQKLADLPLDALVADLRGAIKGIETVTAGTDTRATIAALGGVTQSLERLLGDIGRDLPEIVQSLRQTAGAAESALRQTEATLRSANELVGGNSRLRYDLTELMRELTSAARSFRTFADYLERHPEALVRGKQGGYGR